MLLFPQGMMTDLAESAGMHGGETNERFFYVSCHSEMYHLFLLHAATTYLQHNIPTTLVLCAFGSND